MNNILTKLFEDSMVELDKLTIRKDRIYVKRLNGFFAEDEPITVQVFENGIMMHCDHAGHQTKREAFTVPVWNGDTFEPTGTEYKQVELCKCGAWSYDGDEWNE